MRSLSQADTRCISDVLDPAGPCVSQAIRCRSVVSRLGYAGFRLDEGLELHLDEEQSVFHLQGILWQTLIVRERRAGDRRSFGIERAVVTGAEEPLVVRLPMHTTAEVRAGA